MKEYSRLQFRKSTIEDLEILLRWDDEEHVIASDPNDNWNWEIELANEPPWREQIMVTYDHTPIGFIQVIDPKEEESHYWGDIGENFRAIDIWIGEVEYLNRGLGTKMMKYAIELCFSNPAVHTVLIDPLVSNVDAIRFYQRIGFKPIGERKFNDDLCLVHELKRDDYFQSSRPH
ncbi:GNAT family N-acetyltransferase [Leptospira ryugenii]|nr:GNAT family N-acetyltransferase [Leptospira ryugenii]